MVMARRPKPPTSKVVVTVPVHTGIVANPSTLGAPTPERILDELAYARDDHDNPRSSMPVDAMFNQIALTIYGHAPIAEAQRQGFTGTNMQLMEQGRRPYFDRCVRDLLDAGRLTMPEPDVIALPADATYEPGNEPGSGMRQARRMNLALAAGTLLDDNGLEKLFPPMGERQYAELVESMRLEGYDISKPAVIDRSTGMVLDGKARLRAAAEAGVNPQVVEVHCSDDLERLRYAVRGNLMHRYMAADDMRKIRQRLSDLRLSTTEMKKLLGKLVEGEGQVQSVLIQPVLPATPEPVRRTASYRGRLFDNQQARDAAGRYAYEMYVMADGPTLEEIGRRIVEMYHPNRDVLPRQSTFSLAERWASTHGLRMPGRNDNGNGYLGNVIG